MSATKIIAPSKTGNSTIWYRFSSKIIKSLMTKRLKVLNFLRQKNILVEQDKHMVKEAKINLREGINLAKSK